MKTSPKARSTARTIIGAFAINRPNERRRAEKVLILFCSPVAPAEQGPVVGEQQNFEIDLCAPQDLRGRAPGGGRHGFSQSRPLIRSQSEGLGNRGGFSD